MCPDVAYLFDVDPVTSRIINRFEPYVIYHKCCLLIRPLNYLVLRNAQHFKCGVLVRTLYKSASGYYANGIELTGRLLFGSPR